MAETKLKHQVFEEDSILYFYDGELPVVKGVVTIPHDTPTWAGNAWMRGYRLDPDSGETLTPEEVHQRNSA